MEKSDVMRKQTIKKVYVLKTIREICDSKKSPTTAREIDDALREQGREGYVKSVLHLLVKNGLVTKIKTTKRGTNSIINLYLPKGAEK